MIVRIVTMEFHPQNIESFKNLFELKKEKIRQFPGCQYLELLQGKNNENIFKTYSHWDSEEALDNYRHSELFAGTWKETKALFAERATAISLNRLHSLA